MFFKNDTTSANNADPIHGNASFEKNKGSVTLKTEDYDRAESSFNISDSYFHFDAECYRECGFDQFEIIKEKSTGHLLVFLGTKVIETQKKYVLLPLNVPSEIVMSEGFIHYEKAPNQTALDYPDELVTTLKKHFHLRLRAMFGKNIIHEIMIKNSPITDFFRIVDSNLYPFRKYCAMHSEHLKDTLALLLEQLEQHRQGKTPLEFSHDKALQWLDFCLNLPLKCNMIWDPIESSQSYMDYIRYVGNTLFDHGEWLLHTDEHKNETGMAKKSAVVQQTLIFFALSPFQYSSRESQCYQFILEHELGIIVDKEINLDIFCVENPKEFIRLYDFLFQDNHLFSQLFRRLLDYDFTFLIYYRAMMLIRLSSAHIQMERPDLAKSSADYAFSLLSECISRPFSTAKFREMLLANFERLDTKIKIELTLYYFEHEPIKGKELLERTASGLHNNQSELNAQSLDKAVAFISHCLLDSNNNQTQQIALQFLKSDTFMKRFKRCVNPHFLIDLIPLHPTFAVLITEVLLSTLKGEDLKNLYLISQYVLSPTISFLSLYSNNPQIYFLLYQCCRLQQDCITRINEDNLKQFNNDLLHPNTPYRFRPDYVDFRGLFREMQYEKHIEELAALVNASAMEHKDALVALAERKEVFDGPTIVRFNNFTLENLKKLSTNKLAYIEPDFTTNLDSCIFLNRTKHIAQYYFSPFFRQLAILPYFVKLGVKEQQEVILGSKLQDTFLCFITDQNNTPLAAERTIKLFSTLLSLLPLYLRAKGAIYNVFFRALYNIINIISNDDICSESEMVRLLTIIQQLMINYFPHYLDKFWQKDHQVNLNKLAKSTGNPDTIKKIAHLFSQTKHATSFFNEAPKMGKRELFLSSKINKEYFSSTQQQAMMQKGRKILLQGAANQKLPDFVEERIPIQEVKTKDGIKIAVDGAYLYSCLSTETGLLALGCGLLSWQQAEIYARHKTLEFFLSDPNITLLRLFKAEQLFALKPYILKYIEGDFAFFAMAEQLIPFDRLVTITQKEAELLFQLFTYPGIFALQHKMFTFDEFLLLGKEGTFIRKNWKIDLLLSDNGMKALQEGLYTIDDFIKIKSYDQFNKLLTPESLKIRRKTLPKETGNLTPI